MTDHRPLIPILNSYTLEAVENPRLQRLKEKTSPYLFTAVWRAGKQLCIPDDLSRAPVSCPMLEDEAMSVEAAAHLRSIVSINTINGLVMLKLFTGEKLLWSGTTVGSWACPADVLESIFIDGYRN